MLIFLGKGGVGKSTLAAAVARRRAHRGERILLCEVNARNRLSGLLGIPPVGNQIREVGDNLSVCNIEPEAALHEYAVMKLKFERVVDRLLGNRVVHHFLRLLPSLAEITTLGKLLFHVREEVGGRPRFDAVVLDAPATGHGLSLLRVPQVLLKTIPAGPLREDMLWMNGLLVDAAVTSVQLVTLAEELPVNEVLELNAAVRDEIGLPRGVCFANGLWPTRFTPEELAQVRQQLPAPTSQAIDRLAAQAETSRSQLARLRAAIDLPVAELPLFFAAADGAEVTRRVEALLEAPPAGQASA